MVGGRKARVGFGPVEVATVGTTSVAEKADDTVRLPAVHQVHVAILVEISHSNPVGLAVVAGFRHEGIPVGPAAITITGEQVNLRVGVEVGGCDDVGVAVVVEVARGHRNVLARGGKTTAAGGPAQASSSATVAEPHPHTVVIRGGDDVGVAVVVHVLDYDGLVETVRLRFLARHPVGRTVMGPVVEPYGDALDGGVGMALATGRQVQVTIPVQIAQVYATIYAGGGQTGRAVDP